MKIAENSELNAPPAGYTGASILYEIATLPEPERTKEHITSNGETKTPDEKTINLTQNSILSFVKLHELVIVRLFTGII
ncbi:hypothetical protein ML436_04105 [Staphylococcus roterodami]|nr:hypothetical protein ML436_04105 [Staphylococcus roterodami]